MDTQKVIEEVLKVSFATKALEFGADIMDRIPGLFTKFFPGRKAIVFADKITWKVAGERAFYELAKAGVPATTFIITDDRFHPDWKYVEMIDKVIEQENGILIAVGSGVINDLAKFGAFRHNDQYICVPTVASVDGYTSATAAINDERGAKVSFKCKSPSIIVADSKVLASAPWFLSAAGYGDLASKVTSGAEWMIADLFGTEPIHPAAWSLTQDHLREMLSDPDGVRNGNPETIEALFLGLALAGIGIEVSGGDTRCVSCAEHLYNHYMDMTHHTNNGRPVSHGFQVAIGELTLCAFFDALLEMDLTKIDVDKCVEAWPSLEEEQDRATKIFADFPVPTLGYEEITKKWQPKEEVRVQLEKVKACWPEFREKLRAQVIPFKEMQDLFRRAGAPTTPEEIGLTNADIRKMTDFVQLMRWRINVLDLAKRACFYDELMDKVFGKGGVWEVK
ncbi:MAG: sn-glycerol-1-phosphate dehydrogenase [Bacteroidales bacterium]|nr:sn-glycerol-1-phosphate dehydrogenase [Bacteroidales bacterium]